MLDGTITYLHTRMWICENKDMVTVKKFWKYLKNN